MRCLLFSLTAILIVGCASDYHNLQVSQADNSCAAKIAPVYIETSWYNASIDVIGKHLSGLLLMKNMPDSSKRVVFTNETGVTFFDFGFSKDGTFKVYSIVHQFDKRAVVQTLRKDFELVMGLPFQKGKYERSITGDEVYFGVKEKKETAYFITNKDCASLQRLEWGSARKRKVSVLTPGSSYPQPDRIELTHHTFDMQIRLTRIQKE